MLRPLQEFRTNGPLTTEQYTQLDNAVKTTLRQTLVARRIVPILGPFGFGKEAIAFNRMADVSPAQLTYAWKVDASQDVVNFKQETLPIPVIQKSFRINARMLEASRTQGTPLDVNTVQSAAYQVALQEDKFIFYGNSADGKKTDIDGLYSGAGLDYSTASDWSIPENITKSVIGAMGKLLMKNIAPPYNLVLSPAQYVQTINLMPDSGAKSYRDWIIDVIKGQIMVTQSMEEGKGLMLAAGSRGFFDVAVGIDVNLQTELLGLDHGHDLFGVIFQTLVPRIIYPEALCKLSSI